MPGVRMKINVTRSDDQMIIKRGSSGPKTKSSPTPSSASSASDNQLTIKTSQFLDPLSERGGEPVSQKTSVEFLTSVTNSVCVKKNLPLGKIVKDQRKKNHPFGQF